MLSEIRDLIELGALHILPNAWHKRNADLRIRYTNGKGQIISDGSCFNLFEDIPQKMNELERNGEHIQIVIY